MSDVTATFGSLSSTNATNSPADSTSIGTGLGSNLREIQAHIAALRDGTAWGTLVLTTIAGTNTITATLASAGDITFGPTSYVTGSRFLLVPANTNTGATTLNVTSPNGGSALGAKNVFANGAACVGGELIANVPCLVEYDGTQFNILGGLFPRFKTVSFSRDVSLATGTQAVTGVGFKPKAVAFLMAISGSNRMSIGVDDGTGAFSVFANSGGTPGVFGPAAFSIFANTTDATTTYSGIVQSFDADGFTVSWVKTGSPTGTATIYALCFR